MIASDLEESVTFYPQHVPVSLDLPRDDSVGLAPRLI